MSVAPADANDKWYYKLTTISTTSGDLIAGNFTDYTAVAAASAPSAVATGDKVKFLFIQNQSTSDGIVLCLDGGTAAHDLVDGIFIGIKPDIYRKISKCNRWQSSCCFGRY